MDGLIMFQGRLSLSSRSKLRVPGLIPVSLANTILIMCLFSMISLILSFKPSLSMIKSVFIACRLVAKLFAKLNKISGPCKFINNNFEMANIGLQIQIIKIYNIKFKIRRLALDI